MKSNAYPPLDGLVDLACRDGVDVRPTLLRVLTDLYVQKPTHSAEEETQYVELALGLIDGVDGPTRAAVSASLSAYPAAPEAILGKLAGAAAASDAQGRIQGQGPDKARAKGMPAPEADNLVEIFFAASSEERCLILVNLDAVASRSAPLPAPVSGEVIRRLENAALQRNTGEFSRVLERALGISRQLAERVARDASGEPIVIAAKTLGMKAAVLQRILLILNPAIGQSVGRVYELADLFDELTREAAEQMLAIWRMAGSASQSAYEPALWDDEQRSARSLSTPSQQRAVRGRDRLAERFRSNGR